MRITLVTETYLPQVNGVSRTLEQLVRVLRAAGDQVQLVAPEYPGVRVEPPDVAVPCCHPPFYPELYLPLPPLGRVLSAIREFGPDVVHIATEATLGLAVLRGGLRRGWTLVSSFHTNFDQYGEHYRVGPLAGLIWRYLRWFHNRTRETYVPSRISMASLEARGFERLKLWPRGVDAVLFRPDRPGRSRVREALGIADDVVVIGHVSRIAAEKNVAFLGEALRHVALERPNRVRLLIVGDGPARPELENRLGSAAAFVGYRSGEDLADHYAACDLFAFASRTETFGNVVLEAMAAGLPVVAVAAGGPAETVRDGETGLLVGSEEPPSGMAERLLRLVDDAELRSRMARAARSYAEQQSWDAIMLNLRERYRVVAGGAESSI
ncbi:MAG: glycosyl transferase [Isosphaeraceae bacterium]|jgi:glycosyltransferase involved in cell wall biosynthesis|nr:MAG: glycosyl transferase [Isosphaeraceae bacterium]